MKYTNSIFKMLLVFLFLAQNCFATTPIPGVGVVIKKNPGGGSITVSTGNGGGFSTQLSEGIYELSFPQDQLQTSINGIVKTNYPKSSYQYNGSGVEVVLDNSQITVNSKASEGNVFAIDKHTSSITITVPKGGAMLSGKLGWNDAVMTNSKICPEGFTMQNGECVSNNISGNQQARTEGKIKGKIMQSGDNGMISFSLNANGGTSSSSGVDNSLSFNPSLGIAIHWGKFGIGLDAGMFNTQPNFDFDAYTAPLQNIDFLTITNTKSNWTSTYFMLGPEYKIPLSPSANKESGRHTPFHNKLTFTVALKGGLTINKAPEFSVMDTSIPPKSIANYSAPLDYKPNAFSLKPSIGLAYLINENFAITANAQYLMQIGQTEFTTGYRDLSNVNLSPPVSPIQFQEAIATAPKVMTMTKGPQTYMSFGFGITYCIRKGWDGSIKGTKTVKTSSSNQKQRPCDCCHEIHSGKCPNGCDIATSANVVDDKNLVLTNSGKDVAEASSTENTGNQKQRPCKCCQGFHSGKCPNGCDMATSANVVDDKNLVLIDSGKDIVNQADVKSIGETLTNFRKGWDGSIKGIEGKNAANVKAIAEILVNLARKGWDGSIKGNKLEHTTYDTDVKSITETLVTMQKGWDGSIKGTNVENVVQEADIKTIAKAFVNLRKGWDGSIKGR